MTLPERRYIAIRRMLGFCNASNLGYKPTKRGEIHV
jgi:hypothetical protein